MIGTWMIEAEKLDLLPPVTNSFIYIVHAYVQPSMKNLTSRVSPTLNTKD